MDPNRLLTAADACRFERAFRKLEPHRLSGWSLTGGIAIELHILRCAKSPSIALSTISTSSLPSLPASPRLLAANCSCDTPIPAIPRQEHTPVRRSGNRRPPPYGEEM